ncbi:MAG: hypothetical protein M3Y08_04910 [Fibrobacterota bacterium]|nr:hypothetical protein [Fibrobacterota bacterium]
MARVGVYRNTPSRFLVLFGAALAALMPCALLAGPSGSAGTFSVAISAAASRALVSATPPIAIPVTPSAYIPVNMMYRGATVFGTGKPITVHFIHSIADWGNHFFFMDPVSGEEKPLFTYRGSGHGNQCPDSGELSVPLGTYDSTVELVFMLRTVFSNYSGQYCTGEACGPRYSGLNDPLKSRFHSRGEFSHMARHLWAEAARVTKEQVDSMGPPCAGSPRIADEGGILFSFNDGANDSFGDLVILVTGVEMDVERTGLPIIPPDTKPDYDPFPVDCRIDAVAGGVTRGDTFPPQAMDLPLSAILPRRRSTDLRIFMDQSWRTLDPRRPDETHFPNGPDIKVNTPGPFEFNLGFFTNQGQFVNRARGVVTADMLVNTELEVDGRRAISLMWYPASPKGNMVSTGAYVVKGWLRTLPTLNGGLTSLAKAGCKEERTNLLSSFGYIRR